MSFFCPQCQSSHNTLEIQCSIELPSDIRSDEIALQIVACSRCSFTGIAIYEESRRGAMDSESFTHTGYRVDEKIVQELTNTLEQCPRPSNPQCNCTAHQKLGKKDSTGRWIGFQNLHPSASFHLSV